MSPDDEKQCEIVSETTTTTFVRINAKKQQQHWFCHNYVIQFNHKIMKNYNHMILCDILTNI